MKLNWNFLGGLGAGGGGGVQNKNPSMGGVGIFSGTAHSCKDLFHGVDQAFGLLKLPIMGASFLLACNGLAKIEHGATLPLPCFSMCLFSSLPFKYFAVSTILLLGIGWAPNAYTSPWSLYLVLGQAV